MWACTREWVRVLKPEGSLFVNLGDKYAAGHGGSNTEGDGVNITVRRTRPAAEHWSGASSHPSKSTAAIVPGFRPKTLMGMPWRYALGCVDDLGLILRAEIVWSKPNSLPESVTDRVRRSHEQVFHMVKQPRYFSAVDEVREAHTMRPQRRPSGRPEDRTPRQGQPRQAWSTAARDEIGVDGHPLGKLPGSVWEIPSAPLTVPAELGVDHFAAYPPELCRRIILGWSPSGICTECGEGRRPTFERGEYRQAGHGGSYAATPYAEGQPGSRRLGSGEKSTLRTIAERRITGYACACPDTSAPTRPALVLDPFGGTGTTALVASVLGRTGITNDRSADYCRIAQWRTADPAERARALGVPKPPPVSEGQGSLFDDIPDTRPA